MRPFRYKFVTAGESLYAFLRAWLARDSAGTHFEQWFSRIEFFKEQWSEFLEQLVAVWLTGRLVAAARSLSATHGAEYDDALSGYLRDYLDISKDDLQRLLRLTKAAADAAEKEISPGLKNQLRTWAMSHHAHCYMCGVALDFTGADSFASFTRDHLWPRSYGGDSILENLLPACGKCNSERKSHFATWATTSIQSALLRMQPTSNDWASLAGYHLFALQNYAAQCLAIREDLTLKEGLLTVGHWESPPQITDSGDVVHFFNITNLRTT